MHAFSRMAFAVSLVLFVAPLARAQDEKPAAGGPLAGIQSKTTITDEDRGAIRNWLSERLEALTGGGPGSLGAIAAIRDENKGTNQFKDAFVASAVEIFGPAAKTAKPEVAAQLVAALGAFSDPAAMRVFIDALADARPAVRAAGASGIRALHTRLAGAGGNAGDALDALREAGKKETSAATLRLIYQALNLGDAGTPVADPKPVLAAVLDVLDARANLYNDRKVEAPPAESADVPGVALALSMAKNFADADRDRLASAAARMMRHAVHRYAGSLAKVTDKAAAGQVELRNQTELLIDVCEKALIETLKPTPPPTVAAQMQKGDKLTEMKIEFGKWAKLVQDKLNLNVSLEGE